MKITCGTDIIEIERIKKAIEDGPQNFLNKVYTTKEQQYCESKNKAKYQHYAARFAAKEAVYKAISQKLEDIQDTISLTQIEIQNTRKGKPIVQIHHDKLKIQNIDISISHCKEYAVATVVVIE